MGILKHSDRFFGAVCVSSYEDIRILTHIIGSFGQTGISVGDVYDGLRLRPLINYHT
ncbi:hypothetical protein PQG02_04930 [Nostoc sp. UHCC 0926]|uniref:hypothetical protein n=1 Tax=unclassified Nostoc TaxID=2593658 RepID=UPI00235F26CB|nr:hypothetical protein [Nostoc sp. UHCC 0926]WDD33724.1 hypothetical protein PQG02_04930 [Nostoc sp. UHCC 0926]